MYVLAISGLFFLEIHVSSVFSKGSDPDRGVMDHVRSHVGERRLCFSQLLQTATNKPLSNFHVGFQLIRSGNKYKPKSCHRVYTFVLKSSVPTRKAARQMLRAHFAYFKTTRRSQHVKCLRLLTNYETTSHSQWHLIHPSNERRQLSYS